MVGRALVRVLSSDDGVEVVTRPRDDLDLLDQRQVRAFFGDEAIDEVYLAAAKVGGIVANRNHPADFLYENLVIETNVIQAAHVSGVDKLLFLGSSCIYPRLAEQPMTEAALLTSPLESTNEAYAIAKIAGIKLCEGYSRQHDRDYRSVMPTNLYGPFDNFHPEHSHVIPSLLRRVHAAKAAGADHVEIWGSGTPRREFLHVDDMAAASVFVMNLPRAAYREHTQPTLSQINVGTGEDCSIRELAEMIIRVVGFEGRLSFDTSKPDGTPRKLLDVSLLQRLGWSATIKLEDGLRQTYAWFKENQDGIRR